MAKRVGVLTGGGDCPGLNAVIRAVTRRSLDRGSEMIGVREGWRGMTDRLFQPLDYRAISGLLPRGGTILGTSRTNPYKSEDGVHRVLETAEAGGFDAAVSIATEAIDRLHTTAESHNRVMVVEVMGRHTGWIAVMSGIAGGADMILIPEQPVTVEDACALLQKRHERGKDFSIVVVSEGYELTYESGERRAVTQEAETDQFGHIRLGGVGEALARDIEERTGYETRVTVLGHVQRGGSPTPRDRVLATRFGLKAADLVDAGEFGRMAALQGDSIVDVTLVEATRELKTVPPAVYDVAKAFFG